MGFAGHNGSAICMCSALPHPIYLKQYVVITATLSYGTYNAKG